MQTITELLAQELNCRQEYIANVIALLDEGNTIPFIARYRKELHGAMDDTALRKLEDRLTYLRNLEQRRQEVKSAIEGQEKLTPELAAELTAVKQSSYPGVPRDAMFRDLIIRGLAAWEKQSGKNSQPV
mgnify:CR=1 FL=1